MTDPNLLDRYWKGETSLEEEAALFDSMKDSEGPDALYFKMITEARAQKSQLTFDDIRTYNKAREPEARQAMIKPLYRRLASVAAVLLFVLAAVGLWNYTHQSTTTSPAFAETYDDPYEAYEEVKEALAFVSAKLNKSQSEAMLNIKKAGEYADMFKLN
jgi:hypothetical protein